MSIDVYLSANRAFPLSKEEARVLEAITQTRNALRPLPADEEAEIWELTFSDLTRRGWRDSEERARARGELPVVLHMNAQLPPTRDYAAARRLMVHWCETFALLRGAVSAEGWSAHLDGLTLEWNEATRTYTLPQKLTEHSWKAKVDFTLGSSGDMLSVDVEDLVARKP